MSVITKTGVLAVGYLAGSRAGRHRYDQLSSAAAAALAARPQVRDARSRATNALLRRGATPPGPADVRVSQPAAAVSPADPTGTGLTSVPAALTAAGDTPAGPGSSVAAPAGWTSPGRLRRRTR